MISQEMNIIRELLKQIDSEIGDDEVCAPNELTDSNAAY